MSAYLGNGAVVDADKVTGCRVDLEALVKGQSRLESLGSCRYRVSIPFMIALSMEGLSYDLGSEPRRP